jgi:ABC-2 type transport system ATP-binding protein
MTASLAVRTTGLCKTFDRPAVASLDLAIHPGEFYGLLGPNGAGKTTTLRMLSGLLQPDRGGIEIFGVDARQHPLEAKRLIAWVPDEPLLYDKLTVSEYLEFVAGLWGVDPWRAQNDARVLLERLQLWEHRNQRCEEFSRGMKQKAVLIGALLHQPRLLILDEPLTGLDASIARQVKDLLLERLQQGCTIILTTHLLDVAERLVGRAGIMAGGRLLAEGTLDELRAQTQQGGGTLEQVFLSLVGETTAPAA